MLPFEENLHAGSVDEFRTWLKEFLKDIPEQGIEFTINVTNMGYVTIEKVNGDTRF